MSDPGIQKSARVDYKIAGPSRFLVFGDPIGA